MEFSEILLYANFVSTWYLVGLIWVVQVVHYPLFANVGEAGYPEYQALHQKLITIIVGPPMLVEAFSSVLLAIYPIPNPNFTLIFVGIALVFVIWFSTAFLQVPCHGKLLQQFDAKAHRRLVNTNWIRTIAWTLRGLLVAWIVWSTT